MKRWLRDPLNVWLAIFVGLFVLCLGCMVAVWVSDRHEHARMAALGYAEVCTGHCPIYIQSGSVMVPVDNPCECHWVKP